MKEDIKLFHLEPCVCTVDSRDGSIVDYDCGRESDSTLRTCMACGAQWTLPVGLVDTCHVCGKGCH